MYMPPISISAVEIPVADLRRAMNWYRTALGFGSTWSDHNHALLSSSGNGDNHENVPGIQILLVQTEELTRLGFTNSSNGLHHSVIDFRTSYLQDLHAHLRTQGTRVDDLQPPVNSWAPQGFGFFDSEGNRLAAFTYAISGQTSARDTPAP